MEWNLNTILIMLGVLFLGYGIGLLEMHLRRQKKIRQLESELQSKPEATRGTYPSGNSLLRLWSGDDQGLNLDLDGTPLTSPAAVTAEQRRRLVSLITGLRPWVEAQPSTPAPRAVPGGQSKHTAAVPAVVVEPPQPVLAELSIVAQIDRVLQSRLAGTPLATRGIRLSEGLGGSVLVFIGTKRYEGLEDVPDTEALAAIRLAIADWEKGVR